MLRLVTSDTGGQATGVGPGEKEQNIIIAGLQLLSLALHTWVSLPSDGR